MDKDTGDKIFQGLREGQYARFRLVGEGGEASITMTYREAVLMVDRGFKQYYSLSILTSLPDNFTLNGGGLISQMIKSTIWIVKIQWCRISWIKFLKKSGWPSKM